MSDVRGLIGDHLRQLRRRHLLVLVGTGLILLALSLAVVIWLESAFWMPAQTKSLIWLGLVATISLIMYGGFTRLNLGISIQNAATYLKQFTRHYPQYEDLRYLFDLADQSSLDTPLGKEFRDLAIEHNLSELDISALRKDLETFDRQLSLTRYYHQTLRLSGVALVLLLLSGWRQFDAVKRTISAWKSFQQPNPYEFTITPGNSVQEHGQPFTISVSFASDLPEQTQLFIKTSAESSYRQAVLNPTSEQRKLSSRQLTLTTDAQYYMVTDGYATSEYRIDIQQRPRFSSLQLQVDPPAYTQKEQIHKTYPFAGAQAPEGSRVTLSGILNKPVSQAFLFRTSSQGVDTLQLEPASDSTFNRSFTLPDISARSDQASVDSLWFELRDPSELTNPIPYAFSLTSIPDQYPGVSITSPPVRTEQSNTDSLRFSYLANDDYGIRSLNLHYYIKPAFRDDSTQTRTISLDGFSRNERSLEGTFLWALDSLDLKPRDELIYLLSVYDNDQVSGYKRAWSRRHHLTIQSLTDYLTDLSDQSEQVESDLESVESAHDTLTNQYQQFRESIIRREGDDWNQKRSLEQIKEQRKSIENRVDEINKQFEELKKELDSQSMVDEETMRQYDELQRLMEEIDDPEILEQLEKLQQSLGDLNQQELRKALDQLQFDEQAYQERLKRTVDLFKRLKLNSELDKLAKGLEGLSEQQEQLREQTGNQDSNSQTLRKNQEQLQEDYQQLQERIQQLDEEAPERMKSEMSRLEHDMQSQSESLKQAMQEVQQELNQDNLSSEQRQQLQQRQQQISQQLSEQAQSVQQARQQMNQQQQQINLAALRQVLQNLLLLSEEQESLIRDTEVTQNGNARFVTLAREEQQVQQQFIHWSDSLTQIASEVPQLNNRIVRSKQQVERMLDQSVKQLSERSRSQSTFAQRQVMGGINTINNLLIDVIDQLMRQQQQGGAGGGMSMQQMMEQLQQMSGEQQQMNQQIQQMINDMQGDRLTRSQMDRLNQMAKQQQRLKQQLREMQRQGTGGSGTDKIMSQLERIAEEMDETIRDLRGGSADDTLVERQQNILSRMLQARNAMQERGESEKRQGQTADEITRPDPPEVTLEELRQEIRRRLNDPSLTPYTPEYQRLIERYFEMVGRRSSDNGQ
jgi:hypothetical protein